MIDFKQIALESGASQDNFEMSSMLQEAAQLKPKVIVEIGVDKGGFLKACGQAFPDAIVIGIETIERDELYPYRVIYGDSHDTATVHRLIAALRPAEIDFLFIDGDHHLEAVKLDYELYSPLVRKGGMIGFHDINSRDIEGVEAGIFFRELDKYRPAEITRVASFQGNKTTPGTGIVWL